MRFFSMNENIKLRGSGALARVFRVSDGVFSVAALVFTLQIVSFLNPDGQTGLCAMLAFLSLAASRLIRSAGDFKKCKPAFIGNVCGAAVLAAAGMVFAFSEITLRAIKIYFAAYAVTLIIGRAAAILRIRETQAKKSLRIRKLVVNAVLIIALFIYAAAVIGLAPEELSSALILHVALALVTVLTHIIAISFSQMKMDVLQKIIRKTFAAEILFGLALLIVAFSYVFYTLEAGMPTYGDALWYCFSVVTTIGFGDITAVGPICRVLTVILGIYGIIVVALITSVIVNFYTEVKNDDEAPAEDGRKPSAPAEDGLKDE